jgi:hypothetical protein
VVLAYIGLWNQTSLEGKDQLLKVPSDHMCTTALDYVGTDVLQSTETRIWVVIQGLY